MFNHILVAYDGSVLSKNALEYAVQLAQADNSAHVHVVHAIEVPHTFTVKEYVHVDDIIAAIKADGIKKLEEAEALLSGLGNDRIQTKLLQGRSVDAILGYAEDQNCDLIVMGSRGLNGVQELLLGSVSHNIVQRSKFPVMIVK
jgi:nucleotide-binding universal stress UspA family protein